MSPEQEAGGGQSRVGGRVSLVVAVVVLLELLLQAHVLVAQNVPFTHDDGYIAQAAYRAAHGLGFTSSLSYSGLTDDLSAVRYGYPYWWAPGPILTLWLLASGGLGLGAAFKLVFVSSFAIGALLWMRFAREYLRGLQVWLFGLLLLLAYGGTNKLGDAVVWAITPLLLGAIMEAIETGAPRAFLVVALVASVAVAFTFSTVYLAFAFAASFVLCAPKGERKQLALRAALAAGVPLLVYGLIQYTTRHLSGTTVVSGEVGFYLDRLLDWSKIRNVPLLLSGRLLGAEFLLRRLFTAIGVSTTGPFAAGDGVLVAAMVAMAALARSRWPHLDLRVRRLAAVVAIHACGLFAVLIYYDLRMRWHHGSPPNVTVTEYADRYVMHLMPAVGLFWIAVAGAAWPPSTFRATTARFRRMVAFVAVVGYCACLAYLVQGKVRSSVEMLAADRNESPVEEFVFEAVRRTPAIRIFDGEARRYWSRQPPPDLAVSGAYSRSGLDGSHNSRRADVLVVARGANPTSYEHMNLAKRLHLALLRDFPAADVRIFGGPVSAYATGALRSATPKASAASHREDAHP